MARARCDGSPSVDNNAIPCAAALVDRCPITSLVVIHVRGDAGGACGSVEAQAAALRDATAQATSQGRRSGPAKALEVKKRASWRSARRRVGDARTHKTNASGKSRMSRIARAAASGSASAGGAKRKRTLE